MLFTAVVASLALAGSADASENSSVFSLRARSTEDRANIARLLDAFPATNAGSGVDVWRHATAFPGETGDFNDAHVRVLASAQEEFRATAESLGVQLDEIIANVDKLVEEEKAAQSTESDDWFSQYHRMTENDAWLRQIVARFDGVGGLRLKLLHVGKSAERRDILGVEITPPNKVAGTFVHVGQMHAREHIGGISVQYWLQKLLREFAQGNESAEKALGHFRWVVVPFLNVDGYEYTHTDKRMWRKTRSSNGAGECVGTDPNRNFAYGWHTGVGISDDPCSEIYRGSDAASEVEIQAMQKLICSYDDGIWFVDHHSYGNYILHPWGFTTENIAPHLLEYNEHLVQVEKAAIAEVNGNQYRVGQASKVLYATSGDSTDYAFATCGYPFATTIELSNSIRYGFLWPAERIEEVAEEAYAGTLAVAQELYEMHVVKGEPVPVVQTLGSIIAQH